LLDNNQKGLLALTEVMATKHNALEDTILTSLLNNKLLTSQGQLPAKNLASLPDEESLVSLMIGDLITFQSLQTSCNLQLDQIRELAKYLINKKWLR